MTCVYLSSEDILVIAGYACADMQIVVRDAGLLESAAHRPSAAMFGEEAYPDVIDKAAALLQSLAINHPLFDGNKRMAWLSCVSFLAMNGVDLRPDIDAAERLVIAVATGETDEVKVIAQGLRELVVAKV
ncbi:MULTISPECIES: type II toxin-antitoxin system death-on-curing family toxin [Streptomyces]|uniref:Type II toxin-antitoxin system death-on-curing family toxin n=1 Tax=Streptomyces glycanivorans TaxID=3033808 RepID=A0ABY9JGN3_9ACTN|nr:MULTISPECIES: type II toxin-antitoxin system death-on-curing family toxin [unclassified Streptomyces]WSQ79565.1 type II toxin-antitoxin system death-on-curing family toxin [Streptomyces sp. NBC_01213]TXS09198.1 type II toxin-antitoxin system death-on-curing family toxin [Streptomyces sp. wa22]WLQ66124.1 type II toxin-antitoxin system death-on-curing family toxin [Streptomyces sp. Alt3]WSQ86945.1 type II toxin-antitoxin system death-on-curing family toxin [Streptomyces sp. NBC_01212]WSR07037